MENENEKICYDRMHHIDDYTFKLSSLFLVVNSALLVAVVNFITLDVAIELSLFIAFLGYFSSAAGSLIEGKFQLFAWFQFLKRAKIIESEINFEINKAYGEELKNSRWRFVSQGRITYIFKISIVLLWVFIILYLSQRNHTMITQVSAIIILPWIVLLVSSIGYAKKGHQS